MHGYKRMGWKWWTIEDTEWAVEMSVSNYFLSMTRILNDIEKKINITGYE